MRPGRAGASAMVLPFKTKGPTRETTAGEEERARSGIRPTIVDLGHLRTQAADVDRHVGKDFAALEFVEHRQHFLRLAECKHRDQHAPAAFECAVERFCETLLFGFPRKAR